MLTFELLLLLMLLLSSLDVSAHPVASHPSSDHHRIEKTAEQLDSRDAQAPLLSSANSTISSTPDTTILRTLHDLFVGNTRFRTNVRVQAETIADQEPSFMFLGCVDNRMSPAAIFNAPAGSIMSHNNIGNQYSSRDLSADAALSYAIKQAHVQHIIVLGHYGCKGVEAAITQSSRTTRLVRSWVRPIADLYARTRRREIVILRDSRMPRRGLPNGIRTAPALNDVGFRALVEENVKKGVKELRQNNILSKAYSRHIVTQENEPIDVFVHGLVYDETTGEVHDLHVSFGPPGQKIPDIPFTAVAAAKNIHRDSSRPGINKGKTWDFGSH